MSWITEMRARDMSSAGSVSVSTPGSDVPLVIDLKYPNGGDKAIVTEVLEKMTGNKNLKLSQMMKLGDEASIAMVRACLDPKAFEGNDPPTDDEIMIIVRESGGDKGELIKRCAKLMGIHSMAGEDAKS